MKLRQLGLAAVVVAGLPLGMAQAQTRPAEGAPVDTVHAMEAQDREAAAKLAAGPFHPVVSNPDRAQLQASANRFFHLVDYLAGVSQHPAGAPAYQVEAAHRLVPVLQAANKLPQGQRAEFVLKTISLPQNEAVARNSGNPAMADLYVQARTTMAMAEKVPHQDPRVAAAEQVLRKQAGPMAASASKAPTALSAVPTGALPMGVSQWQVAWCRSGDEWHGERPRPTPHNAFAECVPSTTQARLTRTPDGIVVDAPGLVQATVVPIPGGLSGRLPDGTSAWYTIRHGDSGYPHGNLVLRPSYVGSDSRLFNTEFVFVPAGR